MYAALHQCSTETLIDPLTRLEIGVRREGVTEAAGRLQKDGVIRYARGRIRVLDRRGLEQRVCECYSVVRAEYSRLLPDRLVT